MDQYLGARVISGQRSHQVSIVKHDNGYLVTYLEMPKPPDPIAPEDMPPTPDPDELMDSVVDGISAFLKHIQDRGAGESWKDSEDRVKLRKGFEAMFPNLKAKLQRHLEPVPEPIMKSLVFPTKELMLAFLTKALPA